MEIGCGPFLDRRGDRHHARPHLRLGQDPLDRGQTIADRQEGTERRKAETNRHRRLPRSEHSVVVTPPTEGRRQAAAVPQWLRGAKR